MFDRAAAIERATRINQAARDREAQGNRERITAAFKYGSLSQGHERGAHPLGHSEHGPGWLYPGVRVYDNEPWHWPPKERSIMARITSDTIQAYESFRFQTIGIIQDAIADAVEEMGEFETTMDQDKTLAEAVYAQLVEEGAFDLPEIEVES